ncbi:hypothetical protein CPER28S_02580 [Cellulomonas persica]
MPGACTQTMPRISLPLITVLGSVTFTSPSTTDSFVPVGTPVLSGPGRPLDGGAVVGGLVGVGLALGLGLRVGVGLALGRGVGLLVGEALAVGVADGLGAGVVMPGRLREMGRSTPLQRQKPARQTAAALPPVPAAPIVPDPPNVPVADEPAGEPPCRGAEPAPAAPGAGVGRAATTGSSGDADCSSVTCAEATPPATMPRISAPTTVATVESARCPIMARCVPTSDDRGHARRARRATTAHGASSLVGEPRGRDTDE